MAIPSILCLSTTAGLVLFATIYSFFKLKSRKRSDFSRTTPFSLYKDCDGEATWASQRACSQKSQKIAALLLVFTGLSIAFASAVRATQTSNGDDDESFEVVSCWTRVALWLFLFAQCNIFFRQAPFVTSFTFGGVIAVSIAFLIVDLIRGISEMLLLYQQLKPSTLELKPWIIMGSGVGSQILIGILAMTSCLSIARRPAVFWNGQVVDGQDTVSVIQRYTFAWARPIFTRARGLLQMELEDLPALGFVTRTKNLQYSLLKTQNARQERLWKTVFRAHRITFSWAALITLMSSLAGYAPHLCMYRALSLLELQQRDGTAYLSLWFWAIALGISLLTQQILDIRLEWLTVTRLEIPVRSQLSAIIYRKLMRMKDVGCGQQSEEKLSESQSSKSESNDGLELDDLQNEKERLLSNGQRSSLESGQVTPKDPNKAMTPKSPSERSHRAVVNLIAIDAARIADFCCRCHVLLSSIAVLCIAITALVRLLGWISMAIGLITVILLFPANYKVSKAYSKAQVALMKHRDSRNSMVTDALVGIRQVKFSATEAWWIRNIMKIRDSELKQQRSVFVWIIALRLYWIMSPILFSVASLTAYSWSHGSLSASVAFTALGVFNSLEVALATMPFAVSQLLETLVSCRRIEQHLHEFESPHYLTSGETIRFENATVAWPSQHSEGKDPARFMLRNLSASIPRGKFCIIYGRSGSGKTLLLNSIIGEADLISGSLYVPSPPPPSTSPNPGAASPKWIVTASVAYLAQIPWLENKTIQANILFGLPFDGARYKKVIAATALHDDLKTFDQGDMTEIGPQGTTLSGGQRFRIALAKALYSRAEILVLDDIFSAVDAHVGRHILEEGLLGELCKERTVVLATHHVSLCWPRAHYAIEICENGEVLESNLEQVRKIFPARDLLKGVTNSCEDLLAAKDVVRVVDSATMKPLVEEEFRESGMVRWSVYERYIKSSGGWPIWMLAFSVLVAGLVAMLGRGWWMNLWTRWSHDQTISSPESNKQVLNGSGNSHNLKFYLTFYIVISLSAALLEALKCAVVYVAALRASRKLFEHLISTVLRSRPRWLDITPIGRILNRTTSDFVVIDTRIPGDTHTLCSSLLSLIATSIASLTVTRYLIIPEVILWVVSLAYTAKYLHVARQIKRLDSTLKSPILSLCETSLVGRTTIRAYGKAKAYEHLMFEHIDNLSRAGWSFAVVSCWMSVRLGLIAAFFGTSVAVTIVFRNVDASLAGFALSLSLGLTKVMDTAIRRYSSLTLNMNSTERVVEFCDVDTENFDGCDAPEGWPYEGKVCINSLSVSYALDQPSAVKDVKVDIAARESIGIVGRTGAGKSSLSLAIFRILEARSGSISIDGIDISTIKLEQLRSRMSIIPQDPSLFSGTVRSNLDPTGQYNDSVLRESLRRVHLLGPPDGTENQRGEKWSNENQVSVGDLDTRISEGGSNLSQGQRQLLCLARATISQCKITVMDEATSAVDMHTDAHIQSTLKEHFQESTLIVIAHRLSTVADFDKILVMAEGQAVEFDTPGNLLRKGGEFCKLVEASGERDKIHALIRDSLR